MTPRRIAALGLGALLALLFALTRFGADESARDTVQVELGFARSAGERARAFDENLLTALEHNYFNDELRRRLTRPVRRARIDNFWADTCEVRQIDFERFANWHASQNAATDAPLDSTNTPAKFTSSSTGHRIAGLLQSPASGVDLPAAAAYCRAAGGRLPWAEEGESLAAGRDRRLNPPLYAWGDEFDDAAWPYQDAHRNAAQPCGAHPRTDAANGAHDLAGNVMEWSRGRRDAHPLARRPGAHGAPAVRNHARALYALNSSWLEINARTRSHHLGFRCVYDRRPSEKLPWGARPETIAAGGGDYLLGVPGDLQLARVAVLLPQTQWKNARDLVRSANTERGGRRVAVTRCEITRAEYAEFLRDPLARRGFFANANEPKWIDYTPRDWPRQLTRPQLPVSGINWWAADAFARWAGGRLPRDTEWQLFAAGQSANRYPWGDQYQAAAATGDYAQPGVLQCGEAAGDRSANGINDLAGNLSEWTQSVTAERGDYAAWVQGGNWVLPGEPGARSVFGRAVPLNHQSATIGFRVVYD